MSIGVSVPENALIVLPTCWKQALHLELENPVNADSPLSTIQTLQWHERDYIGASCGSGELK